METSKLLRDVTPRQYQTTIAETAVKQNTLVVLPTGMGKTLIAVLVAIKRLEQHPDSKVLITAPTRPLNAQHQKSFEKSTTIPEEEIVLVTGKIKPEDRIELYKKARIVIATPQTIENDLENGKLSLENFSFLVLDEAHRAVKEYSYPYIAKRYMLQSKFPLILGLTASPGGSTERIEEICKNLFIKAVEIRSETDKDVSPYVQEIEREIVYVDFPEEFKKIKSFLEEMLKESLYWLKEHHYIPTYRPPKKMLLDLQKRIGARYTGGSKNYSLIWAMIRSAEAVKLEYAIELIETQGIPMLHDYLKKMEASKKKTDKRLFKDPRMREVMKIVEELKLKNVEHPKLEKLVAVVNNLLNENPQNRIIIFANYRATVDRINKLLRDNGIKSEILIGQATKEGKGLTQDEQIDILKRFSGAEFNVLIGTQVSEEGLSIADVPYVMFYEPVASEIRMIQRRGRTGRTSAGKAIFLITKGTRDEAYYWSAFRKEKKMKGILYGMKEKGVKKDNTLMDWI